MAGDQLRAGGGTFFKFPNDPSSGKPDGVWMVDGATDELTQVSGNIFSYWEFDPITKEYFPKNSNHVSSKLKLVFKCIQFIGDGCLKWSYQIFKRTKVPGSWGKSIESGTFVRI